jgi:multiple sugar transport system permease protein
MHYNRRIQLCGVAFVAPTLLFFAVFKYGPMLWAIGLSFTTYDMVSSPRFIGLRNYVSLIHDPLFQQALVNTLVYMAGSTVLITLVALGRALGINTSVPCARQCMISASSGNLRNELRIVRNDLR